MRKGGREGRTGLESGVEFFFPHSAYLNINKCKRERERKHTAGKDTASVAGRLPLYPMEMTEGCKILLAGNLFSYRGRRNSGLLHLLVGVVAPKRFEGAYQLVLQGCEAVN